MCQSGIAPIVRREIIGYAPSGSMNADVGTDALAQMTAPIRGCAWSPCLPRLCCSLTVRILRELVCWTICKMHGLCGCLGRGPEETPRAVRGTRDEKSYGMGRTITGLGCSEQTIMAGQACLISPWLRAAPPTPMHVYL